MFRKYFRWVTLFLLGTMLMSCNRSQEIAGDPKLRLTEYISKSFNVKQVEDKGLLLAYLTGDVKQRFESWSPEQFRDAFLTTKRSLIKVSIREVKVIAENEAQITYELVYNEQRKSSEGHVGEAKITNKKLCQMLRDDHGRWMIADVRSIKELIEFKDEFSVP